MKQYAGSVKLPCDHEHTKAHGSQIVAVKKSFWEPLSCYQTEKCNFIDRMFP